MKSMYRIICAVLVAVMVMGMVSAAMAVQLVFLCPKCQRNTSWSPYCSQQFSHNGPYSQHEMDNGTICNYYTQYFHSNRRCTVCKNEFHHFATHHESDRHNACGVTNHTCPY